jgi:hypothetical protein
MVKVALAGDPAGVRVDVEKLQDIVDGKLAQLRIIA